MTPSIKLLPMVVVLAGVALGGRVYDIASGRSLARGDVALLPHLRISEAYAETAPAEAATKEADKKADTKQPASEDKNASSQANGQVATAATSEDAAKNGEKTEDGKNDLWVDPEGRELNKAEIRLLQDLTARREVLDKREKNLMEREALLNAAETQLDQKVTELSSLRGEIQTLLKTYDQKQDEKMASLVKIYEAMKPPDAARIFDNLDMDVLIQVVTRMKEAKTAPILAQMDAARAKELTLQLADRGKLPENITLHTK